MKTLSSFRLTQMAKQNLKYLAKKYKVSEAEIIEAMSEFFTDKSSLEFEFDVFMESCRLKKSKTFKEFSAKYEKASPEEQKAMRQMFGENPEDYS